jgi:hypothetical protein
LTERDRQVTEEVFKTRREIHMLRQLNVGLADCYSSLMRRVDSMNRAATVVIPIPLSELPEVERREITRVYQAIPL